MARLSTTRRLIDRLGRTFMWIGAAAMISGAAISMAPRATAPAANDAYQGVSRVEVESRGGYVTVVGTATELVTVDRTVISGRPEITEERRGDTLVLRVDCGRRLLFSRSCDVGFDLRVPVETAFALDSRSSSADVRGLRGDLELSTGSADAEVRDVEGAVTFRSVSGEARMERVTGDVDARTVSGSLRMQEITGDLNVRTVSGAVTADGLKAQRMQARTVSGEVKSTFATTPEDVHVRTVSGDVRLEVPGGRYDVSTRNGLSGSTKTDGITTDDDAVRQIRARTVSGSLRILGRPELPAPQEPEAPASQ